MYGQFTTTQLQRYAKDQATRLRRESREQKRIQAEQDDDDLKAYQDTRLGSIKRKTDLHLYPTLHKHHLALLGQYYYTVDMIQHYFQTVIIQHCRATVN